jgi:uncharacterized protein (DUF3820 family)
MTAVQALKFAHLNVPFGKFAGVQLHGCIVDYLTLIERHADEAFASCIRTT